MISAGRCWRPPPRTVAPGSGHLLLGRRQTGVAILGTFLLGLAALLAVLLAVPRATLVQNVLSSRSLVIGAVRLPGWPRWPGSA